jgi:uncharacterized membrane protein
MTENLTPNNLKPVTLIPESMPRHRHPTDKELEATVARMLQVGVSLSALLVFAGGALLLRHPGAPIQDYHQFHAVDEQLRSIEGITTQALHLRAHALIQFGLLLLIATPIARVAFCFVGFARQRDRLYMLISAIVLAVLIYSLTRGAR